MSSDINSKQSHYFEIQLKINPNMEDIVSDLCFEFLPCEGVVLAEEAYKDLEMISTTEGTLKIFLTAIDEYGKVCLQVESFFKEQRNLLKSRGLSDEELGSWDYVISDKPNEDWSKKWKEKWDITRVSDRIVIVPDWLEYSEKQNEAVIRLEPGCAFGTGTHQTTQLCMKALEKYMPKDARVADIGMGSGILSVLAKKFGASYVYGCDNDDTVIDVAKENAIKNGVECHFELGTADKIDEEFDFVCANILHFVLAKIMGDLKHIMKKGGLMSLSGILYEKRDMVIEAYKAHNLELVEEIQQDQWTSFVVRKVD